MSRQPLRVSQPIGVFDSGVGGLTVVKALRRQLPLESIVYFGDVARLPYGIKSKSQITAFSCDNTDFLLKNKVKAVVVACNSSSSAALDVLKKRFKVPIIDVIGPAAEEAVKFSGGPIGLIATSATIDTGAYLQTLKKIDSKVKLSGRECPLLVPIIESGWMNDKITERVLLKYLTPLKNKKVKALILGCTHYPLLRAKIQKIMGSNVRIIDSARPTVRKLKAVLKNKKLLKESGKKGTLKIFVSDLPRNFRAMGERFLGESIHSIKVVRW